MSPDNGESPDTPDDLDLLGDEQLELSDLLNTVLDKGVVVHGEVTLAVADVDLIKLNVGLLLAALETVERQPSTTEKRSLANVFGPPNFAPSRREAPPAIQATPTPATETSLNEVAHGLPARINADSKAPETGLARLVLTLIEVLRKVLEHQAIRRMDGGKLSDAEIERLGLALSQLNDRMDDLKRVFGLTDQDLQIDLGPLGRLR